MSSPGANPHHVPPRFTKASAAIYANPQHSTPRQPSAAISSLGANTQQSTLRPTAIISQEPTPTNSVTQAAHTDTSPGARSSRQSNDLNESADHFDAATS
jgi:hypothetical protein